VKLSVTSGALEDLEAWSTANPKVLSRIIRLIAETARAPRAGTGKPERLKHVGGEVWSRRITEKDRLVYDVQSDVMLLAYVDESYTENWFTMVALLVGGPPSVALQGELDRVAKAAAAAYGLSPEVELHGHEIFQAKGAWSHVPPRARAGVFDDVIEAVAAQDVRVIARGLDVVGQQARYSQPDPPHTVVLQHLLEARG